MHIGIGEMVCMAFGVFFILIGWRFYRKRNWRRDDIKDWLQYPRANAKITRKIRTGDSIRYSYEAELHINGQICKAITIDSFEGGAKVEIGEELEVAYRPKNNSPIAEQIMSGMVKAVMDEDWEKRKPLFYFKIMDAMRYPDEKVKAECAIFIGFGILVLLIGVLSALGVIS